MHQHDGESGGDEKIERIRDILFGAQAEDFQKRLRSLEETLFRTLETTRQQFTERLEHLERSLHDGLASLKSSLEQQRESSEQQHQAMEARAAEDRREAEGRFREAERRVEELGARLEGALRDQKRETEQRFEEGLASLRDRMSQRIDDLEGSKADRLRLAKLFADASEALVGGNSQGPDD